MLEKKFFMPATKSLVPVLLLLLLLLSAMPARTQTLTLYVDTETKQVYTEPGKNRVKLGHFRQVETTAAQKPPSKPAAEEIEQRWESLRARARAETQWVSREFLPFEERRWVIEKTNRNEAELEAKKQAIEEELAALEQAQIRSVERNLEATEKSLEEGLEAREKELEEELRAIERELEAALEKKEAELERELTRAERALDSIMRSKIPGLIRPEDLEKKWYDRIGIRGYTQFRYNTTLSGDKNLVAHWPDRSVGPDSSFLIRRARLIIFGNISEHLYLYLQPDFASGPSGSSTTHFGQLRDAYGDIFFDKKREFRIRVGQSKIPYSFENLQSSQLRLALDRNDPLNSCCRDERDIGAFFYWTPVHVRERFKSLLENNLKGSGDYGMLALGILDRGPTGSSKTTISTWSAASLTPINSATGRFSRPESKESAAASCPRSGRSKGSPR